MEPRALARHLLACAQLWTLLVAPGFLWFSLSGTLTLPFIFPKTLRYFKSPTPTRKRNAIWNFACTNLNCFHAFPDFLFLGPKTTLRLSLCTWPWVQCRRILRALGWISAFVPPKVLPVPSELASCLRCWGRACRTPLSVPFWPRACLSYQTLSGC